MKLTQMIEENTITFFSDDKKLFWMKEELEDTTVSVFIGGELLSETMHEFYDEISALISVGMNIIIDFSEVKYIATSYMQALLKIQVAVDKKNKGSIKLKNIPAKILAELNETGITELLWIE